MRIITCVLPLVLQFLLYLIAFSYLTPLLCLLCHTLCACLVVCALLEIPGWILLPVARYFPHHTPPYTPHTLLPLVELKFCFVLPFSPIVIPHHHYPTPLQCHYLFLPTPIFPPLPACLVY